MSISCVDDGLCEVTTTSVQQGYPSTEFSFFCIESLSMVLTHSPSLLSFTDMILYCYTTVLCCSSLIHNIN